MSPTPRAARVGNARSNGSTRRRVAPDRQREIVDRLHDPRAETLKVVGWKPGRAGVSAGQLVAVGGSKAPHPMIGDAFASSIPLTAIRSSVSISTCVSRYAWMLTTLPQRIRITCTPEFT
jgi:hypothetical protein